MSQTIITAGDASAGLVQAAGNDGTLVLQTGASGAKVNALSFAADGTPTLLKPPVTTGLPSMVRVQSANGYGSTNTAIARFTNVLTSQGADITYADSATLGGSFTINTSGVYTISYTFSQNIANAVAGISLNSSQLTTTIGSITAADRLALDQCYAITAIASCSWTGYLGTGSVIRAHGDTNAFANVALNQFTITKVA